MLTSFFNYPTIGYGKNPPYHFAHIGERQNSHAGLAVSWQASFRYDNYPDKRENC